MPRPRAFDDSAVLDAATAHFWSHGYSGTSVRDLGAAMGIGLASLYNAFGAKHALFTRCLDLYLNRNMRERIARLEATLPPREAIGAFLDEIVTRSFDDPRGCLLVNAALEAGPEGAEIAAVVAERLSEMEGFFHRCVLAGQADGSIARRYPAADLARLLLTTVAGLRVLARTRPAPELMIGAARQALALLDPLPAE